MQAIWVLSLGLEDRLEEEMATHSSILAWKIPWTEEPSRLQFTVSQESDMTQRLDRYHHHHLIVQNWNIFWICLKKFK